MLLLDNSAWARLNAAQLPDERRGELADLLVDGGLVVCLPFLLEAGYSARSGPDHNRLLADLRRLPHVPITPDVEAAALRAQSELAQVGHHRLAFADLIIAACAASVDGGVLHYGRDYDVIAARTSLRFDSEWLAEPGALA